MPDIPAGKFRFENLTDENGLTPEIRIDQMPAAATLPGSIPMTDAGETSFKDIPGRTEITPGVYVIEAGQTINVTLPDSTCSWTPGSFGDVTAFMLAIEEYSPHHWGLQAFASNTSGQTQQITGLTFSENAG